MINEWAVNDNQEMIFKNLNLQILTSSKICKSNW